MDQEEGIGVSLRLEDGDVEGVRSLRGQREAQLLPNEGCQT
eukprot:CAMPEP_0204915084 /NCGR_PEP_ID=MMETSP1397-20131031/13105_1 /ASSEMBLY_ACC=CAM_ASM_000891 /TAXON_ID=49980 /ORGANISM="Climacostomum Climacostomum virens, Strain Stock W-24" /LENGTH=40 /DNA_ID= /DNA_START= /DNA_END= /DNA_ORIENTATION=